MQWIFSLSMLALIALIFALTARHLAKQNIEIISSAHRRLFH